jgi:tetratricopeptide (TPR) repeat protein
MSPQKPTSLQDILAEEQQAEFEEVFVGRGQELDTFRRELALPPESRRTFIFEVQGQAGVGKSFLLKRFQQIARQEGARTGWSDGEQLNLLEMMVRLAEDLRTQDAALEDFDERHQLYRQKQRELQADPEMPSGFFEYVGSSLTRAGLWAGAQFLGVSLVPFLNADALAAKGGEVVAFLARKLKKDEVELVQAPVATLTPLWLKGLREVCRRHPVILFLDNYEQTGDFLDEWLRKLVQGRYGKTPLNLHFIAAGQSGLAWDKWREWRRFISRMSLAPFTEEETRAYLAREGIQDARRAAEIFRMTRGLPLSLSLLFTVPLGTDAVIELGDTAIEHFLKGADAQHRQLALDAAIPRRLNRDIVVEIAGAEQAGDYFDWLKKRPFVRTCTNGWEYRAEVRPHLLPFIRRESPERWAALHQRLGDYYERRQQQLGLSRDRQLRDETWRRLALEVVYHRGCENPHRAQPFALSGFLAALGFQRAFAFQWAETLQQADEDANIAGAPRWGETLVTAVKAQSRGQFLEAGRAFTLMLEKGELDASPRAQALYWRGSLLVLAHQPEAALKDFMAAVALGPEEGEYLLGRSRAFLLLNRQEEALRDLDHTVGLMPGSIEPLALRSILLMARRRYEDAAADIERILILAPENPAALGFRSLLLFHQGNYARAAQAISQLSESELHLIQPLQTSLSELPYEQLRAELQIAFSPFGLPAEFMGHQAKSLSALAQGRPENVRSMMQANVAMVQAIAHQEKKEWQPALEAIERAMSLSPGEPLTYWIRAELRMQLGHLDEALSHPK